MVIGFAHGDINIRNTVCTHGKTKIEKKTWREKDRNKRRERVHGNGTKKGREEKRQEAVKLKERS